MDKPTFRYTDMLKLQLEQEIDPDLLENPQMNHFVDELC